MQLEEQLENHVLSFDKIILLLIVAFYHEMKYLKPCYTLSLPSNKKVVIRKCSNQFIVSLSFIDVFPSKVKLIKAFTSNIRLTTCFTSFYSKSRVCCQNKTGLSRQLVEADCPIRKIFKSNTIKGYA